MLWLGCKPLATGKAREGQIQGQERIMSTVPARKMEDVAQLVSTVCNSVIFKLRLI